MDYVTFEVNKPFHYGKLERSFEPKILYKLKCNIVFSIARVVPKW